MRHTRFRTARARAAAPRLALGPALVLAVLALVAVAAALGAAPAAAAKDAGEFRVPHPQVRTLANGLTVLVFEDHDLPTVYYRLQVDAGSRRESAGKAGLASLTADVMRQGTETLSAQELSAKIDFVGGDLSASADRDYSIAAAHVRAQDRELGLVLLADMVLHPAFKEEEVVRQRSQTQAAIRQSRDDPGTVADEHLLALVHGEHPYSRPVVGDEQSVGGLSREDLVGFYSAYWRPGRAVLAVAGDVRADEIFAAVERAFGSWQSADVPPTPEIAVVEPDSNRVRLLDKPDLTQSQIRMGYVGLPRSTPDYHAVQVMNYILGGGGFSSRLMAEVRAKGGLTYNVDTRWSYGLDRGTFALSTFTKNESVQEALGLALDVIRRFREQGPTADELEKAKAFYLGVFPFGFQTPGDVAEQWLRARFYGLGDDYFDRYRERMRAVTAAEVKRVAQAYLRADRAAFVVVGRAADVLPQLAAFGQPETLSFLDRTGAIPEVEQAAPKALAPATPESRQQAAAVVAKGLRAHGGKQALAAVRDWRMRGNVKLSMGQMDVEGESAEFVELPSKRRMEMTFMGQPLIQVMNADEAWANVGGVAGDLTDEQKQAMRTGAYSTPLGLLLGVSDPQADVRYVGREAVGEQAVEAVEWVRDDGRPIRVYFAANTGLLAGLEQLELSPMGTGWVPVQRVFEDYRAVGKLHLPFHVTVYSAGSRMVESTYASVELNVGLSPDLFRRPE